MAAWQFDLMASLLLEGFGPPTNETPHWQVFEDGSGNLIDLLWSPDGSCELWARIDAGARMRRTS